jgi:hypothetical protein
VKVLLDNPGTVHAIDAAGTWDGDPWSGEVVPGAVQFYGGPIKSGPFAACGHVKVRAVLGDEFVPADDPARAGQCPRCAAAVAEGKGFGTPPHEREMRSYFCEVYLRLRIERVVAEAAGCGTSTADPTGRQAGPSGAPACTTTCLPPKIWAIHMPRCAEIAPGRAQAKPGRRRATPAR